MKRAVVFFLGVICLINCKPDSEYSVKSFDEGPLIAVINEDSVSKEFFQQAYIGHIITTGRNDTEEERYNFLNSLINDLLLAQQAARYDVLDSAYFSYMDQVEQLSIADRFYTSSFLDTLSLPDEEQIEAAFFNTKIKLHVSHLFFTEEDSARKAYNRLEEGEKFLDLANELYHITPYDSAAGYIGEISYFNVDDAFGEAAYALKAGEYSEPVRSRMGYHIIYVDTRIGNPLVTQAEYDYKKRGITGLTKQRIKTLKGDAFVRSYMQSLNVQVDENAVEQLFRSLREVKRSSQNSSLIAMSESIDSYASSAELQFVRENLSPETILASYEHLGERRLFKAGDYYGWLKTIPLEEAQKQTMASVGRALRNQVFYEAGLENDIQNDPIVEYNLDYKSRFYKAYLVKKYLSHQPVTEISESEQRAAFEAFRMNAGSTKLFSGWVITASDLNEAREIRSKITSGEQAPESFRFYDSYQKADIREAQALQSHVFRAPVNAPVVVSTGEEYYVLNVTERETDRVEFEEVQDEVIKRMSEYYNIAQELKKLRKEATISIDTVAFESMMEHFNDPSLKGRN